MDQGQNFTIKNYQNLLTVLILIRFLLKGKKAFTHTSIALRDALLGVSIPFIEIHISNVFAREDFRKKSYLSDIAVGVISGHGIFGYELALMSAYNILKNRKK